MDEWFTRKIGFSPDPIHQFATKWIGINTRTDKSRGPQIH